MHLLRRLLNHDNRPPDLGILLSSPDFMSNFHDCPVVTVDALNEDHFV